MQLKTACRKAIEIGYTHLMGANGIQIPLSEIEYNQGCYTRGWFFNGAKSVDPEILKYNNNWELQAIYKLRKNR